MPRAVTLPPPPPQGRWPCSSKSWLSTLHSCEEPETLGASSSSAELGEAAARDRSLLTLWVQDGRGVTSTPAPSSGCTWLRAP